MGALPPHLTGGELVGKSWGVGLQTPPGDVKGSVLPGTFTKREKKWGQWTADQYQCWVKASFLSFIGSFEEDCFGYNGENVSVTTLFRSPSPSHTFAPLLLPYSYSTCWAFDVKETLSWFLQR